MTILRKSLVLLVASILLFACSVGKTELSKEEKVDNLRTFAKLYGYIRFFHPSDEAAKLGWDKFAVYGVKQVLKAKDKDELRDILEELFKPVAPTLKIFNTEENVEFKPAEITPSDQTDYKPVSWQHYGIWLSKKSNMYKSARTHRKITCITKRNMYTQLYKIFDKPKCGDYVKREIGKGLSCVFPVTLYGKEDHTYPAVKKERFTALEKNINTNLPTSLTCADSSVRTANVIIAWNVLQHFYPYFDVVKVDWNKVLPETLSEVLDNKTGIDFHWTLSKMVAKLEDGHGYVSSFTDLNIGGIPIRAEVRENQIVVAASGDDKFKKGDIIESIDGKTGIKVLEEAEKFVSGSPWLRRYRALNRYGSGKVDSIAKVQLLRSGRKISIEHKREKERRSFFFNRLNEFTFRDIKKYDDNIYYINMYKARRTEYMKIIDKLANAKGIIFDNRYDGTTSAGKDRINEIKDIIAHLTDKEIRSAKWNTPKVIRPDREKLSFHESRWPVRPASPRLNAKVLFINTPANVSYGETVMGIIEHYKLGETVGEPTAGCNGNVNHIKLLGDFNVMWTGMKVLKHDGSQHHLVGIKPDYPVKRTIKAVLEGRDECLEKALEVIRNSTK